MAEEKRSGEEKKREKRRQLLNGWREARRLMWRHRGALALGMLLMLVNTGASFVLPWTTKDLIDKVLGQRQVELLWRLAVLAGGATVLQALTGFALSQVVSVAGQKAIAEMRRQVEVHVLRLPASYFDSTKTGVLLSRIMNDAEGIRNLVGTGIIQLVGGLVKSAVAIVLMLTLNVPLTLATVTFMLVF